MSEVREDAVLKARRLGLDLIKPGPADIFVDIDSQQDFVEFEKRFNLLKKLWVEATYTVKPSQTPGHCHLYVVIPELAPLANHDRIALQAALDSDPFREMLAIHHGRAGYEHTSVFFESKELAVGPTQEH